jgi:hypothetical protein
MFPPSQGFDPLTLFGGLHLADFRSSFLSAIGEQTLSGKTGFRIQELRDLGFAARG